MLDKVIKAGSKVVFYKEQFQECNLKLQKILSDLEAVVVNDNANSSCILEKNICYTLDFYAKDSIYKCMAYITSIYNEDKCKCYKIKINSPLKRQDRRRYQRYPCHTMVSYSVLPEAKALDIIANNWKETWKENSGIEWFKHASLEDIGGGGLRFTSRQRLEKGQYLACILDFAEYGNKLKDKPDFALMCQVVHTKKLYSERNLFDVRLKYIGITQQQHERIIRFIFWLERK